MTYLGLGKTLFNSSACLFRDASGKPGGRPDVELVLSERILRKKATGVWPEAAIRALGLGDRPVQIAENRDVSPPWEQEDSLDRKFPFYDYLKREDLGRYSRKLNPEVQFVTHHRCHAMAAVAMSPFDRCVIIVMDGAGSIVRDFPADLAEQEKARGLSPDHHEECSVYLHDRGSLRAVYKRWRLFRPSEKHAGQTFSDGPGIFYEKTAEYVFNSGRAAGKVMGLAAFGKPSPVGERRAFLENLDWGGAYRGKTKKEWEESGRFTEFADLSASVQRDFEEQLLELVQAIRRDFPDYDRAILTGGCALNCTANMKILEKGIFSEIYVPPFPGDESIGFGAASYLCFTKAARPWSPFAHEEQHGYFGPRASEPSARRVEKAFEDFEISRPLSIADHVATLLSQGKIVAWFQGRSESGPRALGNRSILADPAIPSLKEKLNREVKFREAFRPYGASCTHEAVGAYFDLPAGFNSPYMSFAVRPKAAYRDALREVTHVDGTSRIQTVRPGQNPRFHDLLVAFGAKTGRFCLLNTSLNVMGEPIVETVDDARGFLEATPVDGIAVGDFYVRRVT